MHESRLDSGVPALESTGLTGVVQHCVDLASLRGYSDCHYTVLTALLPALLPALLTALLPGDLLNSVSDSLMTPRLDLAPRLTVVNGACT